MKIAVVGSRGYPNLALVEAWVQFNLTKGDVLVSGGARGVDRVAADAARSRGVEVEEIVPSREDIERLGKGAWLARNTTIAERCDRMAAFHDGSSRGTLDAIKKARALGKPVLVFGPYGMPMEGD